MDRGSNNEVYLFPFKVYCKQCKGAESFRLRFDGYKSAHRSFNKKTIVKQASLQAQFENEEDHGMSDWEVTLTDQTVDRI